MSSNHKSSVQIILGVLSAIGLIGAAIFSNWDKIFPRNIVSSSVSPENAEVKSVIQRAINLGSEAYWSLDSSLLEEVFTENALKMLQENIAHYRKEKIKIKSQSSSIQFIDIDITNQSLIAKVKFTRDLRVFAYSLQTEECIKATPQYQQELIYTLKYQTNKWKIFAIESPTRTPEDNPSCQ
ncbi:MAG: hypothetical protein DSM106950_37295 [Stigonema ocellatum SAG 48.90 = DSM 106950]|nr:hypothetical protein [Stigonema ocellatum SAG 48.90 = DSM 106950]